MDKEELQRCWDMCLVNVAARGGQMHMVLKQFFLIVDASQLHRGDMIDISSTIKLLNDMPIRRCKDRLISGELSFECPGSPALAFIAERSPVMSACIMNKKNSITDILESINNFKWNRATQDRSKKSNIDRKRNKYKQAKCSIDIKARQISSKSGWGTVS
jgi:hypothetical protein